MAFKNGQGRLAMLMLAIGLGGTQPAAGTPPSLSGTDDAPPVTAIAPQAAPAATSEPDPEQGTVADGVYFNGYFGLSYALPPGWVKGLDGPPPSNAGLYVLSSLDGPGDARPSMLIVAQDLFFGAKPFASISDAAGDFRASIAAVPGMTIDLDPAAIRIAGHDFLRIDYHAGGLYRVWLATELRCHLLMFNITATDQTTAGQVALGLATMSLPAADDATEGSTLPVCIKDYVTPQALVRRVDPLPVGPAFLKLPVRIIIGRDGHVRHVHLISGFPEQRRAIEEALVQWQFRPPEVRGRPIEVETGLIFQFKPQ